MKVQRIDCKNNYIKTKTKASNYQVLTFTALPNPSKKLSLFEKIGEWFQKKVGLYDVRHEGKYVVESILTPHNLTATEGIVVIGSNANIKGVYQTPGYIEFFGKLAKNAELRGRDIQTYACAKLAGKLVADKNIYLSGNIEESAEFYAETIYIHPKTKVSKEQCHAKKEIKYLENPLNR